MKDSQRSYSKMSSTEDCPPNLGHKIRSHNISQKDKFNQLWPLISLRLKRLSRYFLFFQSSPNERGSYFFKFYFNWNVNNMQTYTKNDIGWGLEAHWLKWSLIISPVPRQCHLPHNLQSLQKVLHRRNRETTRRPRTLRDVEKDDKNASILVARHLNLPIILSNIWQFTAFPYI